MQRRVYLLQKPGGEDYPLELCSSTPCQSECAIAGYFNFLSLGMFCRVNVPPVLYESIVMSL